MSCHPRELKRLRRFPVPERALEAGRKKLLEFMAETPMVPLGRRSPFLLRLKFATVTLCIVVFVTSGAGIVLAAQGTLPGDRLYAVKLGIEGAEERLSFSPARKLGLQVTHAARRLEETERLLVPNSLAPEERLDRMHAALRGYETNLVDMNALVLELSIAPSVISAADRTVAAAEHLFDRHAALVASATVTGPAVAEAMLGPVDTSLELQSDLLEALARQDESSLETREALEARHRRRAEEIQERLETLQIELQAAKPLENLPKS